MSRPLDKWHYDDPKPPLYELAAAYCFALVKGPAIQDGNKRTVYIAAIVFLELNGIMCVSGQTDIVKVMLGAAEGRVGEEALARWFEGTKTLV